MAGADPTAAYTIPVIDLNDQKERQVLVDREKGQYLGHPTTLLLEDGKTVLCVYPKGHGRQGLRITFLLKTAWNLEAELRIPAGTQAFALE